MNRCSLTRYLPFLFRNSVVAALFAVAVPMHAVLDAPVSPNALPAVSTLMSALEQAQGNYIFSGQQEIAWDPSRENEDVNYIIATTGKSPAVRGFDFLHYLLTPELRAQHDDTERAIAWAQNGGIVTFCTHLFVSIGSTNGQQQFYTPGTNGNPDGTNFDIRQAVITGTPENIELLAKFDIMATELKKLRDAGVPVIWRPFHECGGTWFWWSRHGATPFIEAYRMMFNRFTQVHGLTNLIWVFNPIDSGSTMQNWYPGDNYVDMISLDVYPPAGTHPTYATDSTTMRNFKSGRKLVAMSECGSIPDPAQLNSNTVWSYFCTWNGFENDLSRHTVQFLNTVYNHAKVITLDELPAYYVLVPPTTAPVITYQPASRTVNPGVSTTFAVDSSGTPTPTYQWKKNTVAISGATSNTYTIASVSAGDAGNYTVVATNSAGSATSDVATLSVNAAPLVTTQPTAQTVAPGASASFTALFSGSPTPTYQWQRLPAGSGTWANLTNGGDYATATTTTLTVTTTVAMDGDQFRCVATNSVGSATSNGVLLTVQGSPGFTTQPAASQAKTVGGSATFTAVVTGTPTPTLQWRKNSVDISGATNATLSLSTLQVGDAATYTLVATNSQGSATSEAAVLTVWPVRPTTFDAQAFLNRYPDLLALYGALPDKLDQAWIYYLNTGIGNGRSDGDFDVAAYLAAYPSVATLFGSDLQGAAAYWYNTGRQLGHRIPTAFPISAYLVRFPAVATLYGTDLYGAWLYYRDQGVYDGEVFDDLFRVEEYLTLYPELFTVFGDDLSGALLHWLTQGSIEGRLGRIPLEFSATGYLDRNPDVAAAVNNDPLLAWSHYWLYGIYEGRYYDDELRVFEYLAVNADLTAAFVADWRAAALHWMRYGRTEGRLGRLPLIFNVTEYLNRSPDVAAVWGTHPTTVFLHYWSYGIDESRTFDDEFRPAEYLALNADLAAVFGTDLRGAFKHWVRYGRSEGRPGKNP